DERDKVIMNINNEFDDFMREFDHRINVFRWELRFWFLMLIAETIILKFLDRDVYFMSIIYNQVKKNYSWRIKIIGKRSSTPFRLM
ncbi:MAG: hypothetical protein MRT15_11105, partial [archaeon YNP-LCB-003-016]|uniref:hypothetical protein n=1 Tax=Candidatus Culexarchaeum yellowstonense TaxID=2928963 RepID=UPI0026ED3B57